MHKKQKRNCAYRNETKVGDATSRSREIGSGEKGRVGMRWLRHVWRRG